MPLGPSDVDHLLRRVGFGSTPADRAHFVGREIDDVLDEMFARGPATPTMPAVVTSALWWDAKNGLADWWVDRMALASWVDAGTPSPLIEKLGLFWHSHFACGTAKVRDVRALWRQWVAFHELGVGDFEALATAILADGGMLMFFDNVSNVARRPQENLAREIMELHTCGVGNFTEQDVIEMARAWTGHGVVEGLGGEGLPDLTYRFRPSDHDSGPKQLFGLPARNWNGPDTIPELVKGAKQDATARFVATKLWRYYVGLAPDPAIVDDLAQVFVASGMRVDTLLRAIWSHPVFWDPGTRWCLVRQPIEWAADILRRFDLSAADSQLSWLSRFMGQELFNPPNVAGWGTNEYWVSTTAVWGRARFLKWLRNTERIDAVFSGLGDGSRTDAIDRVLDVFGVTEASTRSRERIGAWFDDTMAQHRSAVTREVAYVGGLLPEVQTA